MNDIWQSDSIDLATKTIISSNKEDRNIIVTGLNNNYEVITRNIKVGLEPVVLEEFLPYGIQAKYEGTLNEGTICIKGVK